MKFLVFLGVLVASVFARNKFLEGCEGNIYGCCRDGKTEALDRSGKGCGGKPAYQPKACTKSRYGCCWDDSPASSWDKTPGFGCPVCHDSRPVLCRTFQKFCTSRAGPMARKFLRQNCKMTCNLC